MMKRQTRVELQRMLARLDKHSLLLLLLQLLQYLAVVLRHLKLMVHIATGL